MTERTEGESTWDRLRRRKVVQWGIAYAAGAWGLLQGLAYVTDTFHWPEYIQQSVTLALLIGMPVVLVLAWYHGDRGEQRVTRAELTIITLLFLLGGGIFWRYDRASEESRAAPADTAATVSAERAPTQTTDVRPSIAVLPFENRSAKQDDAFFVDGIHDDILTQLTKIGAMKVIARTSVEQFRDTKLTTKEIGEKLSVTRVVEGGVQRAGDRVRVTVQLIDAATDAHLWAESYDRELTAANVFAIQSEVAIAIAGALNATLSPSQRARVTAVLTHNLEAWEAYQLGRQRMASRASADLVAAEKYFRKANKLDPKFPLPYSGLAETLVMQTGWSGIPESTNLPRAEQSARKALELGPNLAESWAASALVARAKGDGQRADVENRRSIALNPNYATAYLRLASLLLDQGHSDEALTYSKRGLDLDPLSSASIFSYARNLTAAGRFDEAVASYRKLIELDPLRPNAYRDLAMLSAYVRNDFVAAIPFAEKLVDLDPGAPYARCNLAQLYFDLGDHAQAARVMDLARRRFPGSADVLAYSAYFHLLQGDAVAAERFARQAQVIDSDVFYSAFVLAAIDAKRGNYASARAHYAKLVPRLLDTGSPAILAYDLALVPNLVPILLMTGETERATQLLDRAREVIKTMPRLSEGGYGIADVQIYALRGEKTKALELLRKAAEVGWRLDWRYYRDVDPALASIRDDPEFKSVFADIERDMARQRTELAKQPKDAPLDLALSH